MNPEDKAQKGLSLIKDAIIDLLRRYPKGLNNSQIAEELKIKSNYGSGHQDYLSWSILGELLNDKIITRKGRKYFVPERTI